MAHATLDFEVGHQSDASAIDIIKAERRADCHHLVLRLLDRLAPGMRCPEIAERFQEVVAGVQERAGCERS